MQTDRVPVPIGRRRIPVAFGPRVGLLAAAFLWAMSASASTRIESVPTGIPGSGGALGSAVALLGDTAAVGAPGAQPVPLVGTGSVDIYRHVGADWRAEAVLLPAVPVNGMVFGSQVALGTDLLVTTTLGFSGITAEVYTFARTGSSWQQVDCFEASGPVSLSGDTLAVGGGAIFVRAGSGWVEQAQLTADAGEVFNSTFVDGDAALAYASAYINNFEVHNYAYFFHRTGTVWSREARIELGDTSLFAPLPSAFALSGWSALIGWNNVVTSYVRNAGGTWSTQDVLDPLTSAPGFGASVALDGDRALVSSPGDIVYGWQDAGTVYVFGRSNGVWTREAHVAHTVVNYYGYQFGRSMALDGDTMLVGAPGANTDAGATGDATVLTDSGGDWTPVATLDPGNDHRGEAFGDSVALSGSTLLVGATAAATIQPYVTGVAYVFDAMGAGWVERARLRPSGASANYFGAAVALDQGHGRCGSDRRSGRRGLRFRAGGRHLAAAGAAHRRRHDRCANEFWIFDCDPG